MLAAGPVKVRAAPDTPPVAYTGIRPAYPATVLRVPPVACTVTVKFVSASATVSPLMV